jgi:hypothetical protein
MILRDTWGATKERDCAIVPVDIATSTRATKIRSAVCHIGKWAIATLAFTASLAALWDVIQQSTPTVQSPPNSSIPDQLPFTVINQSRIFTMYDVRPICDASSEIFSAGDVHVFTAIIYGNEFDIPSTEGRLFPCSLPVIKGNSGPLEDVSKIKWGAVTITFLYRTFLWPFERKTSGISFASQTSLAGQRMWVPIPSEFVLREKRWAAQKYGNEITVGRQAP